MSTFGKKALIWWDYHNHSRENVRRYASTPKDIQLKILQKWYPVGMVLHYSGRYLVVIRHLESFAFWGVGVEDITEGRLPLYVPNSKLSIDLKTSVRNPLIVTPTKSDETNLKRQYKIDRIL